MIEIFVEDKPIDPGELSAQFTYAIDDIRDFASRNTKFSKTIVLPGTSRNNKVFGHIFDINAGNFHDPADPNVEYNFNAAKSAKCLITYDTIPVFKGVIRILEIIIDKGVVEYETAVFGELGGLLSAIGGSKLEELDLSDYDHTFSLANIQASWTASPGSGYYYPLIDYGYNNDGKIMAVETFRPAFYLKTYLDKIFAAAGYTCESDFFETNFFKKLIVPCNAPYMMIEVATALNASRSSNYSCTTLPQLVDLPTVTGTAYLTAANSNKHWQWRRSDVTSTKVTISFNYGVFGLGGSGQKVVVSLIKNPVQQMAGLTTFVNGVSVLNATKDISGSGSISGSHTVSGTVELEPGVTYAIVAARQNLTIAAISNVTLLIEGQPTLQIPIGLGDQITAQTVIPKNILQRDLLSSIVKMFNLYIDEDRDRTRHVRIEPYYQYYDIANIENWDQKLDTNKPVKIKPLGELNARIYEFKYKDDNDYYNELYKKKWNEAYGSRVFDTGNEFVKEKQTVEVIFSPTPLVQYSGSEFVMPAIYKRDANGLQRSASNIRLLLRGNSNIPLTNHQLTVVFVGQTVATYNDYPYAGHLDDPDAPTNDLCFGAPHEFFFTIAAGYLSGNLFNVFWSFYLSEITDKDSKLMTASVKLSPTDIYNLDFSKLYYIRGSLWRLNKVIDYNAMSEETTTCELLKVIQLE